MSSPSPPPAVVGSPINPDGSKEVSSSPLSDLDSNDDGTAEEGEDFYPRTSDGFGEMRDSIARSSAESTRFSFVAMDLEPGEGAIGVTKDERNENYHPLTRPPLRFSRFADL
jgi:hypothetical protein